MNKTIFLLVIAILPLFLIPQSLYADIAQNYKEFGELAREAQMETATELERLNEKLADHQEKLLEICEMYEEDNAMDELDEEKLAQCNELFDKRDS